jgi:hypothetical protein
VSKIKNAGVMYKIGLILLFILTFSSCKKEEGIQKAGCTTQATVRDLTGLDGCGFVFELEDGTRLEPLRIFYCGTPPVPKEMPKDPLLDFVFEAGKKVKIGYELTESASICMVGPMVKITCIEEISPTSEN